MKELSWTGCPCGVLIVPYETRCPAARGTDGRLHCRRCTDGTPEDDYRCDMCPRRTTPEQETGHA